MPFRASRRPPPHPLTHFPHHYIPAGTNRVPQAYKETVAAMTGAEEGVRSHALFGGAITFTLPASFANVSEIRQVPDNQEVFVDQSSDASLILELLELERGKEGLEAAKYFFCDLAEHNEAQAANIQFQADMSKTGVVPHLDAYPTYCLIGTQSISKFHTPSAAHQSVRIYLVNVRLQQTGTDLVLTLNLPPSAQAPAAAEFSQTLFIQGGPCPDPAVAALQEALTSLKVTNWGLFV